MPWKLTHRSIIGLKRLVNSSKINFQAQAGVLFWCGLNRAKFLIRHQSLKFACFDQTWDRNEFVIFWRVKKKKKKKKSHHVSELTLGYLWEEYEKFWFFIMCHDWLNVSGHSFLRGCPPKNRPLNSDQNFDFYQNFSTKQGLFSIIVEILRRMWSIPETLKLGHSRSRN